MKRRKAQTPQTPLRVRITNEEIMRDLLFPAAPRSRRDLHRSPGRA